CAALRRSRTRQARAAADTRWPHGYAYREGICSSRIPHEPCSRYSLPQRNYRTRLGCTLRYGNESRGSLRQPVASEDPGRRKFEADSNHSRCRIPREGRMTAQRSIRWRMFVLFCATAGALLAVCYAGFYLLFERVVREQLDRRLGEVAAPIIADLTLDPEEKDVDMLDITDEYFEVLNTSGAVLQRSKNLRVNLPVDAEPGVQTVYVQGAGEIRLAVIPFQVGEEMWLFVSGESTADIDSALATLRHFAMALLPASLLATAIVFGLCSNQLLARLDAVVRQLRQFVSDASHELRTPLAVLQGETELLLTKPRTTAEYETATRVMDSELKKLSRIVEGLFTLSMADAGQLRIAPEPLYLEEVLEESCALAAPLANQKRIQIERKLERDVLFHGD